MQTSQKLKIHPRPHLSRFWAFRFSPQQCIWYYSSRRHHHHHHHHDSTVFDWTYFQFIEIFTKKYSLTNQQNQSIATVQYSFLPSLTLVHMQIGRVPDSKMLLPMSVYVKIFIYFLFCLVHDQNSSWTQQTKYIKVLLQSCFPSTMTTMISRSPTPTCCNMLQNLQNFTSINTLRQCWKKSGYAYEIPSEYLLKKSLLFSLFLRWKLNFAIKILRDRWRGSEWILRINYWVGSEFVLCIRRTVIILLKVFFRSKSFFSFRFDLRYANYIKFLNF